MIRKEQTQANQPTRNLRWLLVALLALVPVTATWAKDAKKAAKAAKAATSDKALTASQIIAKMDTNMVFETRRVLTTMRIHRRGRTKVKKLRSYSKGENTAYSEFLSPARDKGVKYLKLGDNLWMYLPSAEKTMKISGHMLRQSMMGSDFSYEDMLDARAMRQRYTSKRLKDAKVGKYDCYVIEMKQKKAGETYPTRKVWISKKYFVSLRMELFAASGRLLKVMTMSAIKKFGGRNYPTKMRMINKLRKGTWTEIEMTNIAFKVKLPEQVFSLRNLQSE